MLKTQYYRLITKLSKLIKQNPSCQELINQRELLREKRMKIKGYTTTRPNANDIQSRQVANMKAFVTVYLIVHYILSFDKFNPKKPSSKTMAKNLVIKKHKGDLGSTIIDTFPPYTSPHRVYRSWENFAPSAHLIYGYVYVLNKFAESVESLQCPREHDTLIRKNFGLFSACVNGAQTALSTIRSSKRGMTPWTDVIENRVSWPSDLPFTFDVSPPTDDEVTAAAT